MLNIKSADLTNNTQKFYALLMLGATLMILWFLLPPLITILTNIWWTIGLGAPLVFLIMNYQNVWDFYKRMSWNLTKKHISSDRLWYLWQGYRYLVNQNQMMQQDIKAVSSSRANTEQTLKNIIKDSGRAIQEHEFETNETKKRVLEAKVNMLNEQIENLEPKVQETKKLEEEMNDYLQTRIADVEILKIELEGKAQLYTIYEQAAKATKNASKWMKESPEVTKLNEAIKQIDQKLSDYTTDIEVFRRDILPKMNSNSASRQVDAAAGAKLIAQWKAKRLELPQAI